MAIGSDVIGGGNVSTTQGMRATSNIATARKQPQFIKSVDINQNVCPLVALTKKLGKAKVVGRADYFHLQEDGNPIAVSTSTSYNSSVTTIVLTANHGNRVTAGMYLKCLRTGEVLYVNNRSGDTLTVATRGTWSSVATTAASINSGEELQIIGSAFPEASTAPNGISTEPSIVTNYCQTFRYSIAASGRDMESNVFGSDEWKRLNNRAAEAIQRQKEMAFLTNNFLNANDPTVTGGVEYWISTNITNANGSLTESSLADIVRVWMRHNYGETNLVCFAGEMFTATLDGWGRDSLIFRPDDTMLGFEAATWQSSFGRLKIIRHGLLSQVGSGVPYSDNIGSAGSFTNNGSGGWEGYAFFLNMSNLGEVSWQNRTLRKEPHTETPGVDGEQDTWLEDCGVFMANEKSHSKVYGISGT